MQDTLRRIASGKWSDRDIELLETQLIESAEDVENSLLKLEKYKARLRETFGLSAVKKLESIINYSLDSYSKPWIRDTIETLVRHARLPEQQAYVQETAH
jgi:hypothetical protein